MIHDIRRLPPLLRFARVLGLLLFLPALVLWVWPLVLQHLHHPYSEFETQRMGFLGLSVLPLAMALSHSVSLYNVRLRFRTPDAWRRQACIIVVLGAFPVCAVMLVLFVLSSHSDFWFSYWLSVVAGLAGFATYFWILLFGTPPSEAERQSRARSNDFLRRYWHEHTRPPAP